MSEWNQKWRRVPKAARIVSMVVVGLVTAAALGLVFGIFVRELWNWLMPDLFGLKTITYWQAFGIIILGHFIFGRAVGHGKESKPHKHRRHEHYSDDDSFKDGSQHWKYYDEWWQSEGKQRFLDFAAGRENKPSDDQQ